jgi:hypothetical protein
MKKKIKTIAYRTFAGACACSVPDAPAVLHGRRQDARPVLTKGLRKSYAAAGDGCLQTRECFTSALNNASILVNKSFCLLLSFVVFRLT